MSRAGSLRPLIAAAVAAALLACSPAAATEGDGVRFVFEGNVSLEEAKLRAAAAEELGDFEKGDRRRADVDDAAWQMESLYRREGFAFVHVRYFLEGGEERLTVRFTVSEGPRVILGDVLFAGNEAIPAQELLSYFRAVGKKPRGGGAPFVRSELQKAVRQVADHYYSKGFVEAVVTGPEVAFHDDRSRADVTVRISEGARHVVRSVVFTGDVQADLAGALEALSREFTGSLYRLRRKVVLRTRTAAAYREAGYPDVTVSVEEGRGTAAGDVILAADIRSGPRVTLAGVRIEGNRKTRSSFVRSLVPAQAGDLYRRSTIQEGTAALMRTGIFTRVETALEGDAEATERTLVYRVFEGPSRGVTLDLGWGSYEQARGRIGLQERNLFGIGLHAGISAGGSLKSRTLGARLVDTSFLGSGFTASFPVEYSRREEPSFTKTTLAGSFVLMRKLGERNHISLKYGFEITETTDASGVAIDPTLLEDYNLATLGVRLTRDTRDDFFYPTQGADLSFSLESSDPLWRSDLSFLRGTVSAGVFRSLGERTVAALRLESGLLYPTDPETAVPLGERFFNGGESSVRSFKEARIGPLGVDGDPAGGLGYNILSAELRRRLGGSFAASLFLDAGNVAPNRSRAEEGLPPFPDARAAYDAAVEDFFSDFRTAVGAGLQYLLPVGPARIDVAVNPDHREGEDSWVVHFTLGMAF